MQMHSAPQMQMHGAPQMEMQLHDAPQMQINGFQNMQAVQPDLLGGFPQEGLAMEYSPGDPAATSYQPPKESKKKRKEKDVVEKIQ